MDPHLCYDYEFECCDTCEDHKITGKLIQIFLNLVLNQAFKISITKLQGDVFNLKYFEMH